MLERLPWAISCVACASLALSSSSQANSYQASIDTDLHKQNGNLQIAWIKPPDGALGSLVSLTAIVGSAFSLYKVLDEPTLEAEPQGNAAAKSMAKPKAEPADRVESDDDEVDEVAEVQADTQPTQPAVEPTPAATPSFNENVCRLFELVWNHRKRHLLIPAETGAGKTTLLLGLLKYFWDKSGQTVEIYGSTTKPSPWMGLEDEIAPDGLSRIINLDITKPRQIEQLIKRLRWLLGRMQERQLIRAEAEATGKPYAPTRILLIPDEWNSTLALALRYDKLLRKELAEAKAQARGNPSVELPQAPYAHDELKSLMECLLLLGREDECAEWVWGQDHQVQNSGFNTGYQKNFGIIVPFRKGATQAVEQALIGRSPVVPSQIGKQILQQAYAAVEQNPKATFVYSNLDGHEILEVPEMPTIKRDKLNGKQQRPTATVSAESEPTVSEPKDPWEE